MDSKLETLMTRILGFVKSSGSSYVRDRPEGGTPLDLRLRRIREAGHVTSSLRGTAAVFEEYLSDKEYSHYTDGQKAEARRIFKEKFDTALNDVIREYLAD